MKICIFGAGGRTGVSVVTYALSKQYEVVAFVHSERAKARLPESVAVHVGDVMDYAAVKQALAGCDAVISALGHVSGSDPRMQTKGMRNIVRAMQEHKIERIVSLTGTGVRVPRDTPSIIDRLLNFIVELVDKDRIADGREHVEVLQESGLQYTVVRVLKLGKSGAAVASYELSSGGPAELVTSRKKVAQILVDVVDDGSTYETLPVVSG